MPKKAIDKLYSPRQVRELFLPGVSRTGIYDYIHNGTISPAYRPGGRWLIPESAIEDFIDRLVPYQNPYAEMPRFLIGRKRNRRNG